MPTPLVSVLIDTFNHERFITDALESVLAQEFPAAEREILVVDDESTDRTPEILAKFAHHVHIFRKTNGGQASAFNFAIPQCRGEIVAFLDGDDWWAPGKLAAVAEAFSTNPEVGLIGHSITEVLADGVQRSELVRESPKFRIDSVEGARTFCLRKSFLGTSRMAYRAELLRRIGPVPEALIFEADEYLFTLGALFSEVLLLREPLSFYRLHGQNLFQLSGGSEVSLRRKLVVMLALADSLRRRFVQEGVAADITKAAVEAVQTEADMLRLHLGEGSRLDAFRTELRNYQLHHEDASPLRYLLKYLSLFPALCLSPRQYNALNKKWTSNTFYRKTREKLLPLHQPNHVDRTGRWGNG